MKRAAYDDVAQKVGAMLDAGLPDESIATEVVNSGWTVDEFKRAGKEAPGLGSFDRSLQQGITLGWGDEISAGTRAGARYLTNAIGLTEPQPGEPTDLAGLYNERIADIRATGARDASNDPIATTAGELVGSAVTGGAVTPARAATTMLGMMGQGAAVGGITGGIYGAGTAEGSDPMDRLPNAVIGAGLGAGVGAAVPAIIGGVRALGQAAGAIRPKNAERTAMAKIGQALSRDEMTPADLQRAYTQATSGGKAGDVTIADVAGQNVKGLVESAVNMPGAARNKITQTLETRQASQLLRMTRDLRQLAGTPQRAYAVAQDVMTARQTAAKPLYQQAYAADLTKHPQALQVVEQIAQTPDGKRALEFAERMAANEGRQITPRTVEFVDDLKRGLDHLINSETSRDMVGRETVSPLGRTVVKLKQDLLAAIDPVVPEYAAARNAWAGPSAYLDAMNEGKKIANMAPDEIQGWLARASQSEQEAFRVGAITKIMDTLGSAKGTMPDVAQRLNDPNWQGRIAALMPDQRAASEWLSRFATERGMSRTATQALGNSATARRLAMQEDGSDGAILQDGIRSVASLLTGWKDALLNGVMRAASTADRAQPERNRVIAERLVDRDVFNNLNFLGWLNSNPPPVPNYAPPAAGPLSAPAATGAAMITTDPPRPALNDPRWRGGGG